MAKKSLAITATPEEIAGAVTRDVVVMATRRGANDTRVIGLGILDESGELSVREFWVTWNRELGANRAGSVLTGARFINDFSTILGSKTLKWSRLYPDQAKRMEWQALTEDYEAELAKERLAAKTNAITDIEAVMLPLRKTMAGFIDRYDRSKIRALEAAVLDALRTPPRKAEL